MNTDTAKTFAIGSCQYPGSFFDQEYAYQAWQKLSDDSGLCKADTLLLLGDQIYVDATAGLFDESDFRKKYLYAYEALHSRINEATIPKTKYSLNDDHELNENWEPIFSGFADHSDNEKIIEQGLCYYHKHDICKGRTTEQAIQGLAHPVFLCNSRNNRSHRHAGNYLDARMFNDQQEQALTQWLLDSDPYQVKIVCSPAALMPRLHCSAQSQIPDSRGEVPLPFSASCLQSDSWGGYPSSLTALLLFIARNNIQNIIFVSGDFHFSAVSKLILKIASKTTTVHLAHCSALYAPFPFANANPGSYILEDEFYLPDIDLSNSRLSDAKNRHFSQESGLHCQVSTQIVPEGDGFCFLRQQSPTSLKLEYSRPSLENNPVYELPLTTPESTDIVHA